MRIRRRIILALGATLLIGGVVVWRLTYLTPAWYSPPDPHNTKVIVLADKVEQRLIEEAQLVRPEREPWKLRVRENQINAWLAARLPQWIEHEEHGRWPERLGTPQVRIQAAGITLALPIHGRTGTQTVCARFHPIIADGHMNLSFEQLSLGNVTLPGEPVANLLRLVGSAAPDPSSHASIQQAIEVLAGRQALEPVLGLADKRRIRLLDVQLAEGWIDFTAETLDRDPGK